MELFCEPAYINLHCIFVKQFLIIKVSNVHEDLSKLFFIIFSCVAIMTFCRSVCVFLFQLPRHVGGFDRANLMFLYCMKLIRNKLT